MLDSIQYSLLWWVSGWFGLVFYWTPLAADLIFYTLKTMQDYRDDLEKRSNRDFYIPDLTIGTILNRLIVSFIPMANVIALFDAAPAVIARLFDWIGRVFSMPLVPDTEKHRQQRQSKKGGA